MLEPGDTGAIKIDQVRDAIERSAYRPFEGRRRVVIVNDAEALNAEAQNALLKTLEEPPAASTFVLVTSRPDMLLPTVLSRCQRLRFGRLSPGEVAASLIRDHEYSDGDAHAAASLSDGSIGRALQGATDEFVDAREVAVDLLDAVASSTDPWRRLGGAKALAGSARGGSSDREELARTALRAFIDSSRSGCPIFPRGRTLSRERRSSGAPRAPAAVVRWRAGASRVFGD